MLDVALLLLVLANTLRGWRNGILAGGLGLLGFVLGAGLALWGAPGLLANIDGLAGNELARALFLLVAVLVTASLGQALLGGIGHRLRAANRVGAVRSLNSVLGAVAAAVVTALVVGVVGAALKPVLPRSWARTMNGSHVLETIDATLPGQSQRWASQLTESACAVQ